MGIQKGEIITLSDNQEYICLGTLTDADGRKFLCLITNSEPVNFCFAEEIAHDGSFKIRIVGGHEEKQRLLQQFRTELQNNLQKGQ